jgi:hypothetical protein
MKIVINFFRRIFNILSISKKTITHPPIIVDKEETFSVKKLTELGNASLYWDSLYSTYSDGINMLDAVTVDMVCRSLKQRLALNGISVVSCEIDKIGKHVYLYIFVTENDTVVEYYDKK